MCARTKAGTEESNLHENISQITSESQKSFYCLFLKLLSFYAQSWICEITGVCIAKKLYYQVLIMPSSLLLLLKEYFRNGWANRQRKKIFKDFMGLIYVLSVMIHKSNEVS